MRLMLSAGGIRLDVERRRAYRDEVELGLSYKEFDLLHVLMRNAGRVVSREQLMHDVWHTTFWTSTKTIDVHLGWLRRKLGDDARCPRFITTVRGQGLRFEPDGAAPGHGGGNTNLR